MKAANAYESARSIAAGLPAASARELLQALDTAMRCTMVEPLDVFCDAIERMQFLAGAELEAEVRRLTTDIHAVACYPGVPNA
jgi:hypothetical protein